MPENFMVPFNKEMEELLHAMYTETQMAGPTREFGSGTRVRKLVYGSASLDRY